MIWLAGKVHSIVGVCVRIYKEWHLGKYRCIDIIDDEMKNINVRLKENNNGVENTAR